MFKRKLQALDYFKSENFNFEDEVEFRSLIIWIEDQKIRKYKIQDRGELHNIDSRDWNSAFRKYLSDVNCPFNEQDRDEVIDWLLGYAVRLEYNSHANKNNSRNNEIIKDSNPLQQIDFHSPDFKAGVASLAQLLHIPKHPNHLITTEAVCKLVSQRLSADALKEFKPQEKDAKTFPLKESVLGFETGDYVLNEATKILRLLHIKDLRELQTKINEIIVAVQTITANPKTDTKLGKKPKLKLGKKLVLRKEAATDWLASARSADFTMRRYGGDKTVALAFILSSTNKFYANFFKGIFNGDATVVLLHGIATEWEV